MKALAAICVILLAVDAAQSCMSQRLSRSSSSSSPSSVPSGPNSRPARSGWLSGIFSSRKDTAAAKRSSDVVRLNAPGQRFTATHGIAARKGETKLFVFVVDRPDANYLAISSNIAIRGTLGGPEKYDILMRYGKPPTPTKFDRNTTVTASESYVGNVLYSRDITVPHPKMGEYFLLLVSRESFHEMLITAILDFPPDVANGPVPDFTIRRMGQAA